MKGKGREGKERKRCYKNAQKCYISHPCSESPNDAIFTKFSTVVDLIYLMTYANFGWTRLKGGHFAAVHKLPFSMIPMVGLTTGKHLIHDLKLHTPLSPCYTHGMC